MSLLKTLASKFDEERAATILDGLRNGGFIEPPESDEWDFHDLLMLAGACFYEASVHGELRDLDHDQRTQRVMDTIRAYSLLVAGADLGYPTTSVADIGLVDIEPE